MNDEKTQGGIVDEAAKQAGERHRDGSETLNKVIIALLESDLETRGIRQQYAKELNPKLLDIVGDIRRMRWAIVLVAMATPLVLLFLLLARIYSGLPALIAGNKEVADAIMNLAQKAEDVGMLAAPLTALIIGTFASFIIVYTALLIGAFRGIAESSREKEPAQDIPSAVLDTIQKAARQTTTNNP